jgi:hypothetical protein
MSVNRLHLSIKNLHRGMSVDRLPPDIKNLHMICGSEARAMQKGNILMPGRKTEGGTGRAAKISGAEEMNEDRMRAHIDARQSILMHPCATSVRNMPDVGGEMMLFGIPDVPVEEARKMRMKTAACPRAVRTVKTIVTIASVVTSVQK